MQAFYISLSFCLSVNHKGRMYRHIRPSSITFTSSSLRYHSPLSVALASLSLSVPDARDLRHLLPLELACILRDLCNRRRRRRHHLPNDIHAEDASVPAKKLCRIIAVKRQKVSLSLFVSRPRRNFEWLGERGRGEGAHHFLHCHMPHFEHVQGVPSGRGLGFADMDLGCSTILPGQ